MEVKTIDDYYEQIYAKFPYIPHSDLQRIVKYGWRYIYIINGRGGDVIVNPRNKDWFFMGKIVSDSLQHFYRYCIKLAKKIRLLSIWNKKEYDGYYYFGITKSRYEEIQKSKKTRGRPKVKFNYGNVILYKLFDECKLSNPHNEYFYRVPYPMDVGMTRYKPNFISKDAELILNRGKLTFEKVSVTNTKYEFINASTKYIQRGNGIGQSSSNDS